MGRAVEPHWTTSDPSKSEPVTVNVKEDPPAFAELGLRELIVGATCPAEFVGIAKSAATTRSSAGIIGGFRRPAGWGWFPNGFGLSPLLLLVRLSIKGPINQPGLSNLSGAGDEAPELVLAHRCRRPPKNLD